MKKAIQRGFSLIELTVVMAIISLCISMAVGAHYAWKRVSALDSAESRALATIAMARQVAISTGRPAMFAFGNGAVPYADEMLRNSIDVGASLTNEVVGWCCVLSQTNGVEEVDVIEQLWMPDSYPIVGDVVVFHRPIVWGTVSGLWEQEEEETAAQLMLFLPDGSVSEECDGTSPWATPTNVLWGAIDNDLGGARKYVQARVMDVSPRTGLVRAWTREERKQGVK